MVTRSLKNVPEPFCSRSFLQQGSRCPPGFCHSRQASLTSDPVPHPGSLEPGTSPLIPDTSFFFLLNGGDNSAPLSGLTPVIFLTLFKIGFLFNLNAFIFKGNLSLALNGKSYPLPEKDYMVDINPKCYGILADKGT